MGSLCLITEDKRYEDLATELFGSPKPPKTKENTLWVVVLNYTGAELQMDPPSGVSNFQQRIPVKNAVGLKMQAGEDSVIDDGAYFRWTAPDDSTQSFRAQVIWVCHENGENEYNHGQDGGSEVEVRFEDSQGRNALVMFTIWGP